MCNVKGKNSNICIYTKWMSNAAYTDFIASSFALQVKWEMSPKYSCCLSADQHIKMYTFVNK